jgi:hypothetical protein
VNIRPIAIAAALLAATPATAQQAVTSPAPDSVAVTIYRAPDRPAGQAMQLGWLQGYALITEQRTVDIPAGRATIRFEGVAGGMLPESALVTGLPKGAREKNLDADLLTPRSLYARAFGRPVILRRQHAGTGNVTEEPAIIRSGPDGGVIVQTKQGFEAANCGGLNDSLVYPEVPEGLSAKPTLSVETDSPTASRVTLSLSYLAWGFDWQTNYVVKMREDGRADLTAWVTLASSDPTSFPDATLAVVGGKANREDERRHSSAAPGTLAFRCFFRGINVQYRLADVSDADTMGSIIVTARRMEAPPPPSMAPVTVAEEGLGDLKLYRVPVTSTVASNAQKQVAFIAGRTIKVDAYFAADLYGDSTGDVSTMLRSKNRSEDGLGLALPGGPVAVFEVLDGEPVLAGESSIADRAIGEAVKIQVAPATQVNIAARRVAEGKGWNDYEVTVSNARPQPVDFEGRLIVDDDSKVERPSGRLVREDGRRVWKARVPANGTTQLRYRVRRIVE